MVELGDQEFCEGFSHDGLNLRWSKNYYDLIGVSHTSIDWHGKNGALPIDMSQPIPQSLCNKFDFLTNFGFAEHVSNQYQVWKNIHHLMKAGGWMVHELPGQEKFPGHHEFPWYTTTFFEQLASIQGYSVRDVRYHHHDYKPFEGECVWAVLIKVRDSEFMSEEQFATLDLRRNS
jgi:hypothetical protein